MNVSQKWTLPIPEIQAREHSEDGRDAHDQVEVRDYEISVVKVQVQSRLREE